MKGKMKPYLKTYTLMMNLIHKAFNLVQSGFIYKGETSKLHVRNLPNIYDISHNCVTEYRVPVKSPLSCSHHPFLDLIYIKSFVIQGKHFVLSLKYFYRYIVFSPSLLLYYFQSSNRFIFFLIHV